MVAPLRGLSVVGHWGLLLRSPAGLQTLGPEAALLGLKESRPSPTGPSPLIPCFLPHRAPASGPLGTLVTFLQPSCTWSGLWMSLKIETRSYPR